MIQVRIFKADFPKTEKLLPKRNWTTLRELSPGVLPSTSGLNPKDPLPQPGDLLITLRVEAGIVILATSVLPGLHSTSMEYPKWLQESINFERPMELLDLY